MVSSQKTPFEAMTIQLLRDWAKVYCLEMSECGNCDEQVEFIGEYVAHLMLNGSSTENLSRIEYFLQLQMPDNEGEKMKIIFADGYPSDVFVYINDLNDIDLADVHSITDFGKVIVIREGKGKWTEKTAKSFFREAQEDIYCDYGEDEITLDYAYEGGSMEVFLHTSDTVLS